MVLELLQNQNHPSKPLNRNLVRNLNAYFHVAPRLANLPECWCAFLFITHKTFEFSRSPHSLSKLFSEWEVDHSTPLQTPSLLPRNSSTCTYHLQSFPVYQEQRIVDHLSMHLPLIPQMFWGSFSGFLACKVGEAFCLHCRQLARTLYDLLHFIFDWLISPQKFLIPWEPLQALLNIAPDLSPSRLFNILAFDAWVKSSKCSKCSCFLFITMVKSAPKISNPESL